MEESGFLKKIKTPPRVGNCQCSIGIHRLSAGLDLAISSPPTHGIQPFGVSAMLYKLGYYAGPIGF